MLEENETHYSDNKYCPYVRRTVFVEQLKGDGLVIVVRCSYVHYDRCHVHSNTHSNPNDGTRYSEPKICMFKHRRLTE